MCERIPGFIRETRVDHQRFDLAALSGQRMRE
jgi:hypothetical protein